MITWPNYTYRIVSALFLVSVLLGCCRPVYEADQNHSHPIPASVTLDGDPQWQKRLAFWLDVGYMETDEIAAFASISPDLLSQPNLYTTYGSVGILAELEEEIPNAHAIGAWINTLKEQRGAYDDPLNELPLIVETYWAVATLHRLGIAPLNPEDTVAFVESLQRDDGFFAPDMSLGGAEEEENLVATQFAIDTLLLLRTPSTDETLQKSAKALQEYLTFHLDDVSPSLANRAFTQFVAAARALAMIDPSAVPEDVGPLLLSASGSLSSLPETALMPGFVNDLLDVIERIERSADIPAQLKRDVAARVLPSLDRSRGQAFSPVSIDPVLTYEAIKLIERVDSSFLDSDDLLQGLARYRIEKGWITFVIPDPNPQATYCALVIARQIGFDDYDAAKVGAYLEQFVQMDERVSDSGDSYFAWLGLVLLDQKPDDERVSRLKETAISKVQRLPEDSGAYGELVPLALLAKAMGWDLPDAVRERISRTLQQESAADLHGMRQIYGFTILQSVSGADVIPPETIEEKVLALWSSEGGFKIVPGAPAPDIPATLLALKTLALIHRSEAVDPEVVTDFVWSCKGEYGFNYVPSQWAGQLPATSSVGADLFVTYEGLAILAMLS